MKNRTATTTRIFMVLLLTLPLTIIPKYAFAGGGGAKPFKWCVTPYKNTFSEITRLRIVVYDVFVNRKKVDTVKLNAKELENGKKECFRTNNDRIFLKGYIRLGDKEIKCGDDYGGWHHNPQNFHVRFKADGQYSCKFY